MHHSIAVLAACVMIPAAGLAQGFESREMVPQTEGGAALSLADCVPPPREGDQTSYLSLIVGAEGVADDDTFRLSEGALCLPLSAAGE